MTLAGYGANHVVAHRLMRTNVTQMQQKGETAMWRYR